jgi:hypothetical protein
MENLTLDDLVKEMSDTTGFVSSLFSGWNHGGPIKT